MIQPPAQPQADAPAAPAAPAAPVEIEIGDSPSRGPEDAPVTIAVWTDFQCPFCKRFEDNLVEALEGYEDRVRVVVKNFPLSFHAQAHVAAQAALAAHAQGKYWEYTAVLWENMQALHRPDLERYAEEVGLNMEAFRAALDDETYKEAVDAEMAAGRAVGVTGTPGWFVNGVKFGGARPPAQIRAEIERALNAE
jgi:protein-disulfide isomerase